MTKKKTVLPQIVPVRFAEMVRRQPLLAREPAPAMAVSSAGCVIDPVALLTMPSRKNLVTRWSSLVGLVLATIGSLLLSKSTDLLLNSNTELMTIISNAFGYASMSPIQANVIQDFSSNLSIARIYSWIGYCLFGVGFALQLVDVLITSSKRQ